MCDKVTLHLNEGVQIAGSATSGRICGIFDLPRTESDKVLTPATQLSPRSRDYILRYESASAGGGLISIGDTDGMVSSLVEPMLFQPDNG